MTCGRVCGLALFVLLALCGFGLGILFLPAVVVFIVVRNSLRDCLSRKLAFTAKMQNIICD
jgi:hypothetical protein